MSFLVWNRPCGRGSVGGFQWRGSNFLIYVALLYPRVAPSAWWGEFSCHWDTSRNCISLLCYRYLSMSQFLMSECSWPWNSFALWWVMFWRAIGTPFYMWFYPPRFWPSLGGRETLGGEGAGPPLCGPVKKWWGVWADEFQFGMCEFWWVGDLRWWNRGWFLGVWSHFLRYLWGSIWLIIKQWELVFFCETCSFWCCLVWGCSWVKSLLIGEWLNLFYYTEIYNLWGNWFSLWVLCHEYML
jgi:hypothetical protein